MRCFFAIQLNDEVKDYLYNLMNQLKKDLKKHNLKIRFVPKKNLHITLMFLGEIKEGKLEEIKKIVREIKFNSFKFNIYKLGVFPNEETVRVLYIGIKPEVDVLKLQKIDTKEIKQEVNSFVLYKSELHKDGAKYFLIEEFKAKKK